MVRGTIHSGMVRVIGLLAVGLAVSAAPALGQAALQKVGVFDADRILADSQAGQQALALFNQLRDQRASELQVQQDEINVLRQQALQATPGSLQAASIQRQLEDKTLQIQRLNEDVQNELGQRQAVLTSDITQKIAGIIDALGAEEGYAMIFNSVQSGLVYVDPAIDLTDLIITRLDAALPGGGGR